MKETVTLPVQADATNEKTALPAEERKPSASTTLNRTFASIPIVSGREAGTTPEVLESLITDLAGQLGIRADQITVQRDKESNGIVSARNAQGVAQHGTIYLPAHANAGNGSIDAISHTSRRVIAHEAAHVAQSLLVGGVAEKAGETRILAEIEADAFAEAYIRTGRGWRVHVPLPPATVAADKDFASLVEVVAQSRSAEIARIINLLSYGLFDWAITNDDVFDVLHILALYPMQTARAIARNIGSKYRKHLFNNLNPPHYETHRAEILAVGWAAESEDEFKGEKYQILNFLSLQDLEPLEAAAVSDIVNLSPKVKEAASGDEKRAARIAEAQEFAKSEKGQQAVTAGLEEAHAEEQAAKDRTEIKDSSLDDLIQRIRTKLDEFHVSDEEALELLDAIADQCLPFRDPRDKFQALANGLTAEPLDDLINQIPAKGLYQSERRRKTYVYLVATRPPFKNERMAEKLLSSPWWQFWDTVTSEEAFLAYLLVKSMPPRARAAFLKARGGERWSQVLDELPRNITESETFNFYQGGTEEKDRQSILAELIDDRIWTEEQVDRLDATIRMARAAGEAQFVFEQSKRHRADTTPKLRTLVDKYQLYVEGERTTYVEKPLVGHRWDQEGLFAKLATAWRYLGLFFKALKFGFRLLVKGEADFDLNDLEDTGLVRGLAFRDTSGKERKQSEEQGDVPLNVLHVQKKAGEMSIDADRLLIDELALAGETKVTGAPVTCTNLHVAVKYNEKNYKLISLEAGFDELTVKDCAIVKGDSIYSINFLKFVNVRLRLSNESFDKTEEQDGLGAMFKALLDPKQAMGVRLHFDLMQMNGVATSGGLFVQSVEIADLTVQAGGNKEAYIEALKTSLGRLEKRIQQEELAIRDDPEHAADHEKAKAWLEAQREKTSSELKKGAPQGSVIDIRSIKVSNIPGLTTEGINLADIHGQGQSATAVVPIFADPTSIRNIIKGSEAAPTIRGKLPGEEEFSLAIREFKSRDQGPLRLVGAIPSAQQAQQEFDEFVRANKTSQFKEGYQEVYDALKQRAADALEYEKLANRGIQNLPPDAMDRFRYLRRVLTEFEERRATIIEALKVEGITVNIAADGNPELIAETLSASGIKTFAPDGRPNLKVGEVSGKGVSLSASFTGGLANAKEWRKTLQGAGLKADQLTIKDIQHEGSGAIIEELTFEGDTESKGLDVTLQRNEGKPGGASLGVKSRKVVAKGVSIPAHAAILRAELERIKAIPEEDRLPEEKKRHDTIVQMLADLDRIQAAKQKAEEKAETARNQKEKAAAQKQIDAGEKDLKDWQDRLVINQLTIDQLDILITGLGDVFAEGYDFKRDAPEITVQGAGEEGRWFQQAEASGVRNRTAAGDQVVANRIVSGPVSGKLKKTQTGYVLEGLVIASLTGEGVSYASGDMKVQAIGESTLYGIKIDAELIQAEDQSTVKLDKVRIERIVANNLKYEDADKVVTVISGELLGLELTNMVVTMPDDPKAKKTVEGNLTLDSVKSLALSAVASGYKVNASGITAPKPEGQEARALSVDFAKSGEISVALQGLSGAADVEELGKGNKVHVQWKNLGGKVVKNGDNYTVTDLAIGNVTLSQMNWTVGTKTITIKDRVTLTGIKLDLEAALQPKKKGPGSKPKKEATDDTGGKEEEPEKELSKLYIKKLVVDQIDARKVNVVIPAVEEDKAKGIAYSPFKNFDLESAVVKGLTVTGFDVLNMHGKVEVSKSLEVTNLRTQIGDIAKGQFTIATASFKTFGKDAEEPGMGGRELSATLTAKDGTIIKLGRTDTLTLSNIWNADRKLGKKGMEDTTTVVSALNLKGITAGDLVIKEDFISLSDLEIAGPIGIIDVRWFVTGASRQKIYMKVATLPEPTKISLIQADFKKVPTGRIVDGKEETKSELDKFSVGNLIIPKILVSTLTYYGPLESKEGTKTIDLEFPTAIIEGVTITEFSKSFTDNLTKLDATITKTSAPNFVATITETIDKTTKAKRFGADLTTGEIRADAVFKTTGAGTPDEKTELESGYYQLTGVGLRNVQGTLSETGKRSQTIDYFTKHKDNLEKGAGIDIGKIRSDTKGTTVEATSIRGVRYLDPNLGLTLDIQELAVPGTTTIPKTGPITIPDATITNAYFHVDDLLALNSGSSESKEKIDTEQFYGILDHVNGNIVATIYMPIHLSRVGYGLSSRRVRQDEFSVDIPVTNGKINYEKAWKKTVWLRNRAIADLEMDTDAYIDLDETSVPDWSKSYLTLEVFNSNIFEWTPADDAERREMTDDKIVQLKRLVRPDKGTPEEEAKAAKEREEDLDAGKRDYVIPEEIELRDVNANIGISGYVPLDLGSMGKIALGAKGDDAVTALKVVSKTRSSMSWGVDKMALTIEELNIAGTKLTGDKDKKGGAEIRINGIEGGSIQFTDGKIMSPKALEGTVTNATVKNLAVDLGE